MHWTEECNPNIHDNISDYVVFQGLTYCLHLIQCCPYEEDLKIHVTHGGDGGSRQYMTLSKAVCLGNWQSQKAALACLIPNYTAPKREKVRSWQKDCLGNHLVYK